MNNILMESGLEKKRLDAVTLLADRFVSWQTPYGRVNPSTCPFVFTENMVTSCNFHSPTFLAIGLYHAWELTGINIYKEVADRYIVFYLSCLRNPPNEPDHYAQDWIQFMEAEFGPNDYLKKWSTNILNWPFIQGMALAGYKSFREINPYERAMDSKAAAIYEWLLYYRWEKGSYFRNGYGNRTHDVEDAANSDDLCHMGRGLIAYYELTKRKEVLRHSERLAQYYLTECELGTYKGCWSSRIGSWIIAPTSVDSFEHFSGKASSDIAWGFSSVGAIEFLTALHRFTNDESMKIAIAEKCCRSMQWQFDECQFDDGSVGMSTRDDKWVGMTAAAILSFVAVKQSGFLDETLLETYRPKALAARNWLLENLTDDSIDQGGYQKVSGLSEPRPLDNLAWLFGLTLRALCQLDLIG
ncbi:MAG: hypothetical protein QGI31_07570 [Dehalococcoidia bacterium]|jgi:hypothetical protein|nr:hypothetical protein [Dehalococcoidia bacterium]